MSCFNVGDLRFDARSALLVPFFDVGEEEGDFIVFGVEVLGTCRAVPWSARLQCDALLRRSPGAIHSIRGLSGTSGRWQEAEDENGEARALLSTLSHEPVYDAAWALAVCADGRLEVTFSGTADFAHGDGVDGPLPIQVQCPLDFDGISCARRTESECRGLLKMFGIRDEFRFARDGNGVSQLVPVGYP